jgi:hypothetical protein
MPHRIWNWRSEYSCKLQANTNTAESQKQKAESNTNTASSCKLQAASKYKYSCTLHAIRFTQIQPKAASYKQIQFKAKAKTVTI